MSGLLFPWLRFRPFVFFYKRAERVRFQEGISKGVALVTADAFRRVGRNKISEGGTKVGEGSV